MNKKFASSILGVVVIAAASLIASVHGSRLPLSQYLRAAIHLSPLLRAPQPFEETRDTHRPPSVAAFSAALAKLPLPFEPNRGQSRRNAVYLARGANFNLYLNSSEAILSLPQVTRLPQSNVTGRGSESSAHVRSTHLRITRSLLHLRFTGANPSAPISALDPLVEKVNYLDRTDSAGHQITQVPTFAKVQYQNIYPGIDLAYHGTRRQLEYDFVVGPGADPTLIRMNITGGKSLRLDRAGNLLIETSAGLLTEHKPLVYQQRGNTRQEIAGSFQLVTQNGSKQVAFALASYDHTIPLVIDPTLVYQNNFETPTSGTNEGMYADANAVAVDSAGNAYATGTSSEGGEDAPEADDCYDATNSVDYCGPFFVVAINSTGTALIYDTYVSLGTGFGIAADAAGNAYVAGGGAATGTPNAFQPNPSGAQCPNDNFGFVDCSAAVIAVLNPAGTATYVTNLGGNVAGDNDEANAIAIDASGKIYVTGQAFSPNFPTTTGAFQNSFSSNNGINSVTFVAKIDPTLSGAASLIYSTFLGGGGQGGSPGSGVPAGDQGQGIAVNSAGDAYVTGDTFSRTLATAGSFQSKPPAPFSPFVAKFNASGSALLWATYLGGTQGNGLLGDQAYGIALDSTGNAYVTGQASTADFPTTPGAFHTTMNASSEAFVTELNSTGASLIYSTFVGGYTAVNRNLNQDDCGYQGGRAIALDASDDAYITGFTYVGDFPIANLSLIPTAANNCMFLAELNPNGTGLLFSSYMPGSYGTLAGIALDNAGGVYISSGGSQNIYGAQPGVASDVAWVDKVDINAPGPAVLLNPQALTFAAASATSQPVTLKNLGNGPLSISGITESGSFTETDNCTPTVAAGSSCTINVTNTGGSGTLSIADNAVDSPQVVNIYEAGTMPMAQLSRSVLAFDAVNVGSTSPAQVVFLASTGNTPLVLSSISTTGDFKEVNNCPMTILVDTSCQISVTFTPTASGTRTGTLVIDDNAGAPSEVTLTGGAPGLDLQIVPANGYVVTITPGQTAKYQLQVFDLSGYSGPVTVTCSGAPKGAKCEPTSPITLNGFVSINETVSVTTTPGSSAVFRDPEKRPNVPGVHALGGWLVTASYIRALNNRRVAASILIALVISLFLLFAAQTRRRTFFLSTGALLLCAFLTSCGSHTTIIVEPPPASNATPPGTYTLTVTVTANGSSATAALTLQVN